MDVLFGYNEHAVLLPVDKLVTRSTIAGLHPEVLKRVLALIEASGGCVGIGEGSRTQEAQEREFKRRHQVDPKGLIVWDGKRWSLRPGMAPLAPPDDRSYHLPTLDGKALAMDLTGDLDWANANGHRFMLRDFSHVGAKPEKWHFQPEEIPTARSTYNAHPERYPLHVWSPPSLPAEPPPDEEDDDMAARFAFIGIKDEATQALWIPGAGRPIEFDNPDDRDALLAELGVDTEGATISRATYDRLH